MKNKKQTKVQFEDLGIKDLEFFKMMLDLTPTKAETEEMRNEQFNQFVKHHDWSSEPTHMAKSMSAWARKNILLDAWNQYIHSLEAEAEFMGDEPKGKGWRAIGNMRRIDLVDSFRYYFNHWLDEMLKEFNDTDDEE